MYDELVKRLRDLAGEQMFDFERQPYLQADDAIEKLSRYVDSANEANIALYGALPRWIPVTERLPEHGWHLAYGPTIKMEVLHFHSAEEVWSSERYYNIEVTHWMPLPEPPKEET